MSDGLLIFSLVICATILFSAGYAVRSAQAKITDLERRVHELEEAKHARNPYRTNVGLEDTIASLLDIQQNTEYINSRLNQARGILGQIRSNPDSYDEDRPNGKRNHE
ncbi:MAG: hypothetical protein ABFD50_22270 [Smithella sp.]